MGIGTVHDHSSVCPVLFGGQSIVRPTGQKVEAGGTTMNAFHGALLEAFGIQGSFGRNGATFGDYAASALGGVRV